MKDAAGHDVSIAYVNRIPRDMTAIRMNVDDFDEGVSYFESQGYAVFGTAHETESSVTALMTNSDGTYLRQHRTIDVENER